MEEITNYPSQCANIYKNLPNEKTEIPRKDRWKNVFHKSMTYYLLLCYQCFSTVPPAGAIYSVTN